MEEKEKEQEKCCDYPNFVFQEGCQVCLNCRTSKCGM